MEIQIKKLKDLKPNPLNPRKSSVTQDENLKKSLEKFGVVEPIVFNKRSGYIVGGHFRVRELKKLGYKEVECVIVDLSPDDEKELLIRLNANTGDWDTDLLLQDWDESKIKDWGLEIQRGENGYFQQQLSNNFDENEEIKMPYPITIVVDESDYKKWQSLKKKYKEEKDLKLFLTLLKEISL